MAGVSRIRLIATDIDGTLITERGVLPSANRAALAAAHARGVRLVLSTIRKRQATEQIAGLLDLPCTMICEGGASIYDADGTPLQTLCLPQEIAHQILDWADAYQLPLMATSAEQNYYLPAYQRHRYTAVPGADLPHASALRDYPITRFIVRGEQATALLMERLEDAPLRIVRHYAPDGELLDAVVTSAAATKEAALRWLLQRWELEASAVLALGDSEADVGMIQLAGIGVAMENAHPSVRAAADWVAPLVASAGLAAAVERFVLQDDTRL